MNRHRYMPNSEKVKKYSFPIFCKNGRSTRTYTTENEHCHDNKHIILQLLVRQLDSELYNTSV